MTESRPAILVIDDEPDVLATLRTILEAAGFDVTVARGATEAIGKLNICNPDVIVTDIYMPGGDGYELLVALRTYRLMVPVIAISGGARGDGRDDPLKTAAALGAVAVITKPFLKKDLIGAINSALAHRLK